MFDRRIESSQHFALIIDQMQTSDSKRFDVRIVWHKSWIWHENDAENNVKKMLQFDISLMICTDFKFLYECFVKLKIIYEKRLMIDVMSLRQSYEKREITEVR